MYALETDTVAGFPGLAAAGTGEVVRINGDGSLTTIATGLTFPTAMTFGPDGNLYVSNLGFGVPVPGAGEIVRIDLSSAPDALLQPTASATSAGPATVVAASPNPLNSASVSPVEPPRREMGRVIAKDGVIGIAHTPPVPPAIGSQALSFTGAPPSAASLTSNLPPSARRANRSEAVTDWHFASLEAEPSLAVSVDNLALASLL
jgi:hypothetical protein